MMSQLRALKAGFRRKRTERSRQKNIRHYLNHGRVPWSTGYLDYRTQQIAESIQRVPDYALPIGQGLDERIIEIPWIFANLSQENGRLLDAGSSLNHDFLLDHSLLKAKDLSICTYYPEHFARHTQRISYVFADLREMPFRDNWFDEVVCISTLEHIDMDNSMYGYEAANASGRPTKSYSYLKAVNEMIRVVTDNGRILITVPFGKFENHGFFQQFDEEMLQRLLERFECKGSWDLTFFRYVSAGWIKSNVDACRQEESFNPHTGKGKKSDGAAHSRAICCIAFTKKSV